MLIANMLTRDQAASIFDKLRKLSTADEIELLISGGRSALTRFANNTIHQNVAEEENHISVRVSFGGRTARATTNKHDDDSLRRVVQSAEALARVQQHDPDLLPMPTPEEVQRNAADAGASAVQRYFDSTARLTPQTIAPHAVAQMVDVAKKHSLTAAGIFSSAEGVEGIFNSRGVADWYEQTLAEVSITMIGRYVLRLAEGQRARRDTARSGTPGGDCSARKRSLAESAASLPPGKYTVILEPAAVLDAVGFMFWDFGGSALLEQRSFLNERIGTQLFGENITVWDDVYHPLQAGLPFDGEGMKRHRLKLIDKGVVQRVTFARSSAARCRQFGVGQQCWPCYPHRAWLRSCPTKLAKRRLISCSKRPKTADSAIGEQMIACTERGILVTRLWYIREVDPYEKILTGMTRDGTFLVERWQGPVAAFGTFASTKA